MLMLEACLDWIALNLSELKTVHAQSEQGCCYHSHITKVALGLLNFIKPVRVARYVHSGVQDGKDLLDAHFARALAHGARCAVAASLQPDREDRHGGGAGSGAQ